MKQILSSPEKQIFLRGHYSVESFFVIRSGQSNIQKDESIFKNNSHFFLMNEVVY
jgi:hypothetical protein